MDEPSKKNQPKAPKYQQVGQALLRDWEREGRRPETTQKTLAEQYGVHLLTLRHALQWLKQTGQLDELTRRQLEPAPTLPPTTRDLQIGLPIWADSVIDLDFLRVNSRLSLARTISWELDSLGYHLDVQFVGPEKRPDLKKIAELQKRWNAVILEPFSGESQIVPGHPFHAMRERTVLIGAFQGVHYNCICPDLYAAGELAIAEFARLNVRRILYTGRREESAAHRFLRIAAAETAAHRHSGIEIIYAEGGFHIEEAFSAIKRFFLEGGQCDGILCESSYASIGALRALTDIGIRCPEEVQLISIGKHALHAFQTPRPTVIGTVPGHTGRQAARMAVALCAAKPLPRPNIVIPVQLLPGETTQNSPAAPGFAPSFNARGESDPKTSAISG